MSHSLSPSAPADDDTFDQTLIAAAFRLAATEGWRNLRIAAAARSAGLPLARVRLRFPTRGVLLIRFGRLADAAALAEPAEEDIVRDRLFGMLMRRLDVFQAHREGVLALLESLPFRPRTTLFLGLLTEASMAWILGAAGVGTSGIAGRLRVKGLTAVWIWTLRAWQRDQTADLAPTMAALDAALRRAERAAGWLSSMPFAGPAPKTAVADEPAPKEEGEGEESPA
ncbi:MAG TPA: TetR family transcriptional regulator [Acetobacteraceae bacterium]|nr:TetR family transcriptional regulator [Acetobacteraceae bacterium]